jgi:hypothetical protein
VAIPLKYEVGEGQNRRKRKNRLRASRAFVVAVGLFVGGCAAAPVRVASAPPLDYRQLVSDSGFVGRLRADPSSGLLEVSGLTKTVLGEPGDWRTCLRATKSGKPVYYAVFFVGDVIEDARQSVAIDRCEQEQEFAALPPSTPKPKSKARKSRSS